MPNIDNDIIVVNIQASHSTHERTRQPAKRDCDESTEKYVRFRKKKKKKESGEKMAKDDFPMNSGKLFIREEEG